VKAYLLVTGTIFGLLGIAHLLRVFLEGHAQGDSSFLVHNVGLFLVCTGLAVWAGRLLVSLRRPPA
jgi:hypothetical protein